MYGLPDPCKALVVILTRSDNTPIMMLSRYHPKSGKNMAPRRPYKRVSLLGRDNYADEISAILRCHLGGLPTKSGFLNV
jgi:hypothetical protein